MGSCASAPRHLDPQVLVGQHVIVQTRTGDVPGVIGKGPRDLMSEADLDRASRIADLWVDVGARDADEAFGLIAIGDPLVIDRPPTELANGRLASRALETVGAWVVLEAARRAAAAGGVRVPLWPERCDGGNVMDGARATATRSPRRRRSSSMLRTPARSRHRPRPHLADWLGHGPALTGARAPPRPARLQDVARAADIPWQMEAMTYDVDAHRRRRGARRPRRHCRRPRIYAVRHMHSPSEFAAPADLDQAAGLICAASSLILML